MKKSAPKQIADGVADWREATLGLVRQLIHDADPHIVEEVKWRKPSNASFEGNARRAIDLREGEKIDASAFKPLVRAAIDRNTAPGARRRKRQ